jgi:GT2 family glycosyltransferase
VKVTIVIVTYGDRFIYLKQVIKSASIQNIEKIIIISNGASRNTLNGIQDLKKEIKISLHLIDLKENTGSASGFYHGIKYAYDNGAEFIWLLDDDNMPLDEALQALKLFWNDCKELKKPIALLSYRDDRKVFKKALIDKNPRAMLGRDNSFLGFHIFDLVKRIAKKNNVEYDGQSQSNLNYGQVLVAPYGGLFFHRSLIELIGFPDKRYFLYGDDYDFSYRITKNNGFIFLVMDSLIKDLETSFHLKQGKEGIFKNRFLKTDSKDKIFFATRNGIWFENNFVTNNFMYYLNSFAYIMLTFVILTVNYKHLWKFIYILKGTQAGFKKW